MLGQHSLGNEIEKILYSGHGTTDGSYLKQYVDQCLAGIDTGKYLYLAHPDLFIQRRRSSVRPGIPETLP